MKQKSTVLVSDTLIETNHIVLPSHTNGLGTIFGGVLMSWIDITAAICAQRHSRRIVVTASIDSLHFLAPARVGDIVTLTARVIFTGRTSMTVRVNADSENVRTGERHRCVTSDLSFVALDAQGKPTKIPAVHPKSKLEKQEAQQAATRRKVLLDERQALKAEIS